MKQRIAIFNGFPFHYEMFGCVLEYLTSRNITFDIFSETRNEMGWIKVYESRFGNIEFRNFREYNPHNYDYVFLLTDDDPHYKWSEGAKIIMFEHSGKRNVMRKTHQRVQLRQYASRGDTWFLPVWNIRQRTKDLSIMKIVAIGNNCPSNPDELKPWFYDLTTPKFVFINRKPAPTIFDHSSWVNYSNVKLLENIDADQMLEEAATADWLIILPKNEYQYKMGISAIHPIAYGVGVPILMKKEWIPEYNLGGIRPFDNTVPLAKPTEELLKEVHRTRNDILKRADKILSKSLEL